MKKSWIIALIAALLIIILILVFYPKTIREAEYDVSNEETIIFISGSIKNLEECQGHSQYPTSQEKIDAGYDSECIDTTDIDDSSLNKLKLLEGIKGISICGSSTSCSYDFTDCDLFWEFNYQTRSPNFLQHPFIEIYQCENKFYLVSGSPPGPPIDNIYRINPSEELINQLQF